MLKYDEKHTNSLKFKALALTNLNLVMLFQEGNCIESFSQNKYFIKDMVVVILFVYTMNMTRKWFGTKSILK